VALRSYSAGRAAGSAARVHSTMHFLKALAPYVFVAGSQQQLGRCVWSATPLGARVSRRGKWVHNPGSKLPEQKSSPGRCSELVELTAWRAVSMPAQGASFFLRPNLDRFDCCLRAAGIRGPSIGEMAERFVQYAAQAAEENAAFPLRADKRSSLKRHSPLRERIGRSSMQSSFLPRRGASCVAYGLAMPSCLQMRLPAMTSAASARTSRSSCSRSTKSASSVWGSPVRADWSRCWPRAMGRPGPSS
jgi:hypothetical protein